MSASGTHANTTISYPIAFNSACYSVASTREGTSADSTWNAVIDSVTKSSFRCQLKIGLYWIATGLQQWGYQNPGNSTSYNMTVTFPVAYQSNVFSLLGYHQQNSGSAFASGWLYVENISLSSFRMKWRNNMFWAAIGVQQWRYEPYSVIQKETTFSFPISFSSTPFYMSIANVSTANDSGGWGGCNGIASYSPSNLTNFKVTWYADSDKVLYVFAIGKQQWGKNGTHFTGTVVYTFPIAFNTLLMWISNSHNTSSTNDSPWACGGWNGTTTTLSVYSKGTDVSYIAIGI